MMKIFLILILNFSCLYSLTMGKNILQGNSKGMDFQLEEMAQGLGIPWGMVFINPTEILFTEQNGKIFILNVLNRKVTSVQGVPKVMDSGQGGLLDVALPPNYKDFDWIYFTYVKEQKGKGVITIARARLRKNQLVQWQDLLITSSASDTNRHFGSRITFDSLGHLFFTVGDRGVRPNAQDLSNHAGSILRLNLDGTVPKNNPFVSRKNSLKEIWSYGHRNPQGIVFDPLTKRLWAIEHGPRGGDEINLIEPGKNYGWPIISYGKEYWGPFQVGEGKEKKGMEQPVKIYIPSIAPGSLLLYSGKAFPEWKGNLFAGALKSTHISRIELDQQGRAIGEERLLLSLDERIRSLLESPEGWLYLSTDSGKIYRLKPR